MIGKNLISLQPSYINRTMSEISDAIQAKCLAIGDRIIKLNDYLQKEAANAKPTYKIVKGKRVYEKTVPVYLQSVSNLCNQLLRAGTSIGANNAEATSAISKADFKSKSFIALKEARESLYWIDLLHRNGYLDDKQYQSIYDDAEELVKILVTRCKKINQETLNKEDEKELSSWDCQGRWNFFLLPSYIFHLS